MENRYCGACCGERGCRDCKTAARTAEYTGLTEFLPGGLCEEKTSGCVAAEAAYDALTDGVCMPEELLLAADIGTTTLAFVCADEKGMILASYGTENPQRLTAADVIGRIDAACRGKAEQLKGQIREALAEGFLFVLEHGQRFPGTAAAGERIPVRIALAGNTTMQHLLLGYPLDGMAKAPFIPYSVREEKVSFSSLFSGTAVYGRFPDTVKQADVYVFPCLSAFVGGDVLAGAYALSFPGTVRGEEEKDGSYLLADFGTNGELFLSVSGKIYAAAAAMGSAFEGGRFAYASDLFRLTAKALREGAADETGLLCEPYFTEGFLGLYQEDIRTLQLAKGAVRAGIELLCRRAGISAGQIKAVFLAGGAGKYCREEDLLQTGVLPEALKGKIKVVGNSCIGGVLRYLKNRGDFLQCGGEVLNLAEEPEFEELYYRWMEFREGVQEER